MQAVNEKLRETLRVLNSNYFLAGAFLLRDGTLLNYELFAWNSDPSDALDLIYYAARIAIEKAKNGCIDEAVIASEECKIAVSWVNSRVLLAAIARPLVDTNLILNEIKRAGKEAKGLLAEAVKQEQPLRAAGACRIGRLQLTVVDGNGLPVSNCLIEVYDGRKKVQADLTTQSGMASFKLVMGEYELVVKKKGYESFNTKFLMNREFMARSITLKSPGE